MRWAVRRAVVIVAALVQSAIAGCASDLPQNPSFPVTLAEARLDLERMEQHPATLQRPLIIAAGYGDPGWGADILAGSLRPLFDERHPIVVVHFFGSESFEECARTLCADAATACTRPGAVEVAGALTCAEVDVIGISMGGLAARHAAACADGELQIVRLLTISTPHQGALLALLPTTDARQVDMRKSSAFLAQLDDALAEASYELIPYTRLNDSIVGEHNTAPPGQQPWWVGHGAGVMSHFNAHQDPRILADIARRLRGEEPWTREPRTPLPTEDAVEPADLTQARGR